MSINKESNGRVHLPDCARAGQSLSWADSCGCNGPNRTVDTFYGACPRCGEPCELCQQRGRSGEVCDHGLCGGCGPDDVEPTEATYRFPRECGSEQERNGWTLDYNYLEAIQKAIGQDEDAGYVALETIESVLLSAEKLPHA